MPLENRALLSTLTVTNDNDSGTGSLRYELGLAQAGSTIDFAPSAYGTIALTSGPLSIGMSVNIQGPGASKVTVDGGGKSSDFLIAQGVEASISGLTITGGYVATPNTFGGVLAISGSTFAGNQANAGAAGGLGIGGAILNQGGSVLSLADSLVMNNSAIGGAASSNDPYGGFGAGGGLVNQFGTTATVTDSTFLGNRAIGGSSAQARGYAGPA